MTVEERLAALETKVEFLHETVRELERRLEVHTNYIRQINQRLNEMRGRP